MSHIRSPTASTITSLCGPGMPWLPLRCRCRMSIVMPTNALQSDMQSYEQRIETLQRQLAKLERDRDDLEIALSTAIEHGDAIESQLALANEQLQGEVRERRTAERHLRELLEAITKKSQDLELVVKTITEHSDTVEDLWLHRYEASELTARTDPLTELANRRLLDESVAREWANARRHGHPVAMLVCDVDHFKRYNDCYGHQTGDACLRQVAGVLREHATRETDLAARYGGEEFVVLLPGSDSDGASQVGHSIREAVEALGLPHATAPDGIVTISVGVAAMVPDHNDDSLLFADADRRLYLAKQLGRNRVIHAG